jgi:hypothetical protein
MGFLNNEQLANIINSDSSLSDAQKSAWVTYANQQQDPYAARDREAARLRGFEMAQKYRDQAMQNKASRALANSSQEFRDSYDRSMGQGAFKNFGLSPSDVRQQRAGETAIDEVQSSYNKADRAAFQAAAGGVGPQEAAAGITAEMLAKAKAEKEKQDQQPQPAAEDPFETARKKYIYGENNPDWSYSTKW